jgi:hypothetical protein
MLAFMLTTHDIRVSVMVDLVSSMDALGQTVMVECCLHSQHSALYMLLRGYRQTSRIRFAACFRPAALSPHPEIHHLMLDHMDTHQKCSFANVTSILSLLHLMASVLIVLARAFGLHVSPLCVSPRFNPTNTDRDVCRP